MHCTKCGSAVGDGDRFCTRCGAPLAEVPALAAPQARDESGSLSVTRVAGLTNPNGEVIATRVPQNYPVVEGPNAKALGTVQKQTGPTSQPWRALLEPGEEPLLVTENASIQVINYGRWKVDNVIATGQRLMCVSEGKILECYPRNTITIGRNRQGKWGVHRGPYALRACFTIDPVIVRAKLEARKKAYDEYTSAIRRDKQQRTFLQRMFSRNDDTGAAEGLWYAKRRELLNPAGEHILVWVWGRNHFFRRKGIVMSWDFLERRVTPCCEIRISDRGCAAELLDLLEQRSEQIRELLRESGDLWDLTARGAMRKWNQFRKDTSGTE